MAAITASSHDALPPSWDETIVPSLRKRLESESRILAKRLSTISITDEGPPSNPPESSRHTVSPPQGHVGETSNSAGSYSQRPSAIPRPSYSRVGERSTTSPSPPPQATDLPRNFSSKRQRTQSTPFPFDPTLSSSILPNLPNGNPVNGMPTSSSGTGFSRVQSPSLGRTTPTPSRIPTSRVRSGSQSSQGFGSLNGGKASLPPSHRITPSETTSVDSDILPNSLRLKDSSSSLARRIVDEKPPFTNDLSPKILESEFTGRPSSDEERPFQHWYRGDVSRNGGVGEYRVGRRMEMLDIANFGHAPRGPTSRTRPYEEPAPHSENIKVISRKRAESVSSRERASIYIDPQEDTVTGRVLDEMPLTDIEAEEIEYERERDRLRHSPEPSRNVVPQRQPHQAPTDNGSIMSRPSIPSAQTLSSKPEPRTRQPLPLLDTQKRTATTTDPSTLTKPGHNQRNHARNTPNSRGQPLSNAKGQKRSKSAANASGGPSSESSEYVGLADAVPETRSPLPRNGNWDEVILPTVARRMGIEYEKEDPVMAAKRKARESRVAPAPGTFGYDHTKYKPPRTDEDIPMGEFGQRNTEPEVPEEQPEPALEASPEKLSNRSSRPRRETMPSPAPFSHYASPPNDMPAPDPRVSTRGRRERQDVPHILVSPPTMDGNDRPAVRVEEGEDAGCCKCVVM